MQPAPIITSRRAATLNEMTTIRADLMTLVLKDETKCIGLTDDGLSCVLYYWRPGDLRPQRITPRYVCVAWSWKNTCDEWNGQCNEHRVPKSVYK